MPLIKRLSNLFAPAARNLDRHLYTLTVRCGRCGEIISAPVDLRNDLSVDYEGDSGATTYVCRKALMGRQRCFQTIEVTLRFDEARRLLSRDITGGQVAE